MAYTDCTALDCDIVFASKAESGKPINWHRTGECEDLPGYDVNILQIALHELGHYFSYDHELNNNKAVMGWANECLKKEKVCAGEKPYITCTDEYVEKDYEFEMPDGSIIKY